MESRTKRRGHGGLIVLIVIVVLLALVCAAPFVINAQTHFEYDDYLALAAAGEAEPALSAAPDKERMLFHMDKSRIYRLLADEGLLEAAEAELGGKVAIERIGYSLSVRGDGYDAGVEVCAAVKLLGLIPAQLRALGDVSVVDAGTLRITPREVWYGPYFHIGAEKLAKWTGMEELTEGVDVSLSELSDPLRAEKLRLADDGFTIVSPLLRQVIDEVAAQDGPRDLRLLRLYFGNDELPSAFFDDGRAAFLRAAASSMEALRSALREVVTFATDEYRCALIDELSVLPFDLNSELVTLSLSEVWDAQHEHILETQAFYHEMQTELRNAYWHKEVTLSKTCLLDTDGAPLENRLPAEWEARIVLQYNKDYDAIVKTNEGNPRLIEPIPGLPLMSELPRASWDALPPEGDGPFDLTVALRLPSGIPAVVFLTAEDDFGLAVISEALFRDIREKDRLPIYCSQDIASAPRSEWLRLYVGEDRLNGNYINVP